MNKRLMHRFIREVYGGDIEAYRTERKADYCKAQLKWACWMDELCKNGEITEKQWNETTF